MLHCLPCSGGANAAKSSSPCNRFHAHAALCQRKVMGLECQSSPRTCACRCTAALLYAATPVPVRSTTTDGEDPRWLWRSMSISGTSFAPGALASRSTKHLHASKGAAPSPILVHRAFRLKSQLSTNLVTTTFQAHSVWRFQMSRWVGVSFPNSSGCLA